MKKCYTCRIEKPESEFYRHHGGLRRDCINCYQASNRLNQYREVSLARHREQSCGLSAQAQADLFASQGGLCGLCGKALVFQRTSADEDPAHLDHDHITGRARGFLCIPCNTGLGKLGDTLEGLERATLYLTYPPAERATVLEVASDESAPPPRSSWSEWQARDSLEAS